MVESSYTQASWASKTFFWWVFPMLQKSTHSQLKLADFGNLEEGFKSKLSQTQLEQTF